MANTYVTETLSGATFYDKTTGLTTTLSGTWLAEYDASGSLVSIYNPSFTITPTSGSATTWNGGSVTPTTTSPYQIHASGSSNAAAYSKLYIDYAGQTPSTLVGGTTPGVVAGTSTSVFNAATGNTDTLQNTGTITSSADTAVTTTIKGATFADGSTLSGSWTAIYDSSGTLQAVENATFVVTSTSGVTNTFTNAGTLPYANTSSAGSYEIRFGTTTGTGPFTALYVDWKSENPSSFYEGSPSLYTSVVNAVGALPIRLVSDGSSGVGSTPVITGLPATESGSDTTVVVPFSGVTVTDSDTSTSATITLSASNVATDANGTLSGAGLTKIGTGTYTLASTTPANLSSELQALRFTPTVAQVARGSTVATTIRLAINDTDGSTSGSTVLTETATCFLRGTLIATPAGGVPVEDLQAGDVVSVLEGSKLVDRAIVWAGRGHMDTARLGDRDDAFPVRIRKDAFATDVPARDLLVTSEHCILTSGGLTPARMLVNHSSILIDRSLQKYEFFHIELEIHAILMAEGLATESYLDTGNRGIFNGGQACANILRGPTMAAPLMVARELVEPVWQQLADRAVFLGLDGPGDAASLTDQPELRLFLDDDTEVECCWAIGRQHMFKIPANVRAVRLLSRSAVPAQVIGPFVDDRRTLGVKVEKLVLWTGLTATVMPAVGFALDGWHAAEDGQRWTNGMAALDLPLATETTYLDVYLASVALYPELAAA